MISLKIRSHSTHKLTLDRPLGLIGLLLILGLVAPREVSMTRSAFIEAPPEAVFRTVNDLSTWEQWSVWKERDPDMTVTLGEPHSGIGGYFTWAGEASGSGRAEIVAAKSPDSIYTHLSFDGQGEADGYWHFEPKEQGTEAHWGFRSDFPYPMNAMLLFTDFEGQLQADYDRGLKWLTQYVEKRMQQHRKLQVQQVGLPLRHFLLYRERIPFAKITEGYGKYLPQVKQAAEGAGLEETGMPCGLFFVWDEAAQATELGYAIPVAAAAEVEGYEALSLPQQRALLVEYYGDYNGTGAAREAVEAYLQEHALKFAGPAIEEYVTDPGQEPNPEKWLTRVYYPLDTSD